MGHQDDCHELASTEFPSALLPWKKCLTGDRHSVLLAENGDLYASGIVDGSFSTAKFHLLEKRVKDVAVGCGFTAVLFSDGRLAVRGSGYLVDWAKENKLPPADKVAAGPFSIAIAYGNQVLVVEKRRLAVVWDAPAPVQLLACSRKNAFAVIDGCLWVCGSGGVASELTFSPTDDEGFKKTSVADVAAISCGWNHLVVTCKERICAFGRNDMGQYEGIGALGIGGVFFCQAEGTFWIDPSQRTLYATGWNEHGNCLEEPSHSVGCFRVVYCTAEGAILSVGGGFASTFICL